jgi:hypothetical protein
MKNPRQEVIYKGMIFLGDGNDIHLPFEIEYLKGGQFTINRTDGKPFDQDFIPDFTYYDDSDAEIENKSSPRPYSVKIKDHITHYSFSYFGGVNDKITTLDKLVRYDQSSLFDLKYMCNFYSCQINADKGTFFLAGKFFSDTVNVIEIFQKMQSYYDIDTTDIGEGDVKDAIIEIYSQSGKEDALDIHKIMENLYHGEDISKMRKNAIRYFEDLNKKIGVLNE